MEKQWSDKVSDGKVWNSTKKGHRKPSARLCCWIFVFSVLIIILACPGLDPLDRKYVSPEYAAYFNRENLDMCRGRRVYMYALPQKFNVDVLKETQCNHTMMRWMDLCPRFSNGGYGAKLWNVSEPHPDDGFDYSNWFDTDTYMLEMIFHTRMRKYKCLTSDASEADALFVPFYTGLLALSYLYDETNDTKALYQRRKLFGMELIEWLETNGGEAWRRFGGGDHFLVMGRTTWDFKQLDEDWGTGFSALPFIANMTNLMLERSPTLEHELAIPYPTAFHPSSPESLARWIEVVKTAKRRYLFSFVGAPRPDSRSIRDKIASSCLNAGQSVCNLVNCSVVRCSHDPVTIYKSFLQSNFCLQPRGDTATRRSAFDCLISGAIPVFFHQDTAYTQYFWHLPQEPESYSVYIPEEDIKKGVSIQQILMSYSPQRISKMRRNIISLLPSLLYNDFVKDLLSPTEDAFDLTISMVLRRIAAVRKQMSSRCNCWISFEARKCLSHV